MNITIVITLLAMLLFPGSISALILWWRRRATSGVQKNNNPTFSLILRDYFTYSLLVALFAISFIFIVDVARGLPFLERISNISTTLTPTFILRYFIVAGAAAIGLPFVLSILVRTYKKHKHSATKAVRKIVTELLRIYKSNKHRPAFRLVTIMPILVIAIVIVVSIQQHYTRSYAPIILSISPNEITYNPNISEELEIVVEGVFLSLDTAIYVNDMRISSTWQTIHEEGEYYVEELFEELSFNLPPELFEPGDVRIVAVNRANDIIQTRSNEIVLNIIETVPPAIYSIAVTTFPDMTAIINIQGEGFEANARVFANRELQSAVIVENAQSIIASISLIYLPLNELDIFFDEFDEEDDLLPETVHDQDDLKIISPFDIVIEIENSGGIISNEYIIANLPRIGMTQTVQNHTNWIDIGNNNLVAHSLGSWDGLVGTNSKEAFLQNYENGFRLFEFSTQFSADGVLFGADATTNMPRARFNEQQDASPFTLLTFEDILGLMLQYNDWWLITDTGYQGNFTALHNTFEHMIKALERTDAELINRIIVQVYDADMYNFLVENFPFTYYVFNIADTMEDSAVLEFLDTSGVQAVIVPLARATDELMYALGERDIIAFAHITDDRDEMLRLLDMGFRGVYTQSLTPRLLIKTDNEYKEYNLVQTIVSNHNEFVNVVSLLYSQKEEGLVQIIFAEHFINHDDVEDRVLTVSNVNTEHIPEHLMEYFLQLVNFESALQVPYNITDSGYLILDGFIYNLRIDDTAITYILYDKEARKLVKWMEFSPQNHFESMSIDIVHDNNRRYFIEYLDAIQKDGSIIIFSVRDEASNHLDEAMLNSLYSLGLVQSLYDRGMYSYVAIIDDGTVIFEHLSDQRVIYERLIDRWLIEVVSAGRAVGNVSSIRINGVDLSQNSRGINIVVFSKHTGLVVDSVSFDTHYHIGITRYEG
ncbi:MAG: hypothetical protein FWC13_00710 [Oscillospiraceae bacterium]|nr:hypothetical protein [Oscillospiraceae bacterium]